MSERSARTSVNLVIDAYLQHRLLSRSDLVALTGISSSAITELTQLLIESGLLEEVATVNERQGRGRPAVSLRFCPSHAYFVGVSIADSASPVVLADLQGGVIAEQEFLTKDDPGTVGPDIHGAIEELLRKSGVPGSRVLGVGVAISGFVDEGAGVCRHSTARNWRDVPIAKLVEDATGIKTYIANDANAVAVGEKLIGRARDLHHFSCVTLSGTIGCSHYISGRLYLGHAGGAGEIGHVTVNPAGPLCLCGKHGCLDLYAGSTALTATAQGQGLACESVKDLEALAAIGNMKAHAILHQGAQALGLVVAELIQINNPECVLFVDVDGFGKGVFHKTTRQVIENNILPRFLASTEIIFHQVERIFLARAAASIATRHYLQTVKRSRVQPTASTK